MYSIISFRRNNILSCLDSRLKLVRNSISPFTAYNVSFVSLETRGPRRSFVPTNSRRNESIIARNLRTNAGSVCLAKYRDTDGAPTSDHVSRQVEDIGVEEEQGETRSVYLASDWANTCRGYTWKWNVFRRSQRLDELAVIACLFHVLRCFLSRR